MREQPNQKSPAPARSWPVEPLTDEDLLNQKKSLAVFESYLRLKNGVIPSLDSRYKEDLLREFNVASTRVREANFAIARTIRRGCRRFAAVYNGVMNQQSFYYGQLIDGSLNGSDAAELAKARLRILQFFERTLFGLVIARAEAGQAELDQSARQTCPVQDRTAWVNLLLKQHQQVEVLQAAVVGETSALAISDEAERMRILNQRYEVTQSGKKVAFVTAEILASIFLWDRSLSPALRLAIGVAALTPLGRAIYLGAGAVYVVGWVAFDRSMREQLSFLKPPPEIITRNSISTWDGTLKLAQDFLLSDFAAPTLYLAYVELLSVMRKQAALEFLNTHEELLTRSEREFGSIENAVLKTKEVLRDELHQNSGRAVDFGGPGRMGAAG